MDRCENCLQRRYLVHLIAFYLAVIISQTHSVCLCTGLIDVLFQLIQNNKPRTMVESLKGSIIISTVSPNSTK